MNQERAVVVTGASTGIGAACVQYFAANGWRVAVNYFSDDQREKAQSLAATARGIAVQGDVGKDEDCRKIAADALAAFGRMDALVCCAGTTRVVPHQELDALKVEDFQQTSAVNTVGPFLMTRACAPALSAGDGGAVVIVSSYGAIYGTGSSIAYAASKGATNTLTLSLARVLAPKVRVNAVCPSLITEGFIQQMDPALFNARAEAQMQRSPLKKVGHPEDVAADVFWLATGARLMTGSVLMLDCGLHLNGDG